MRNIKKSKISDIISLAKTLPYFTLDNLVAVEKNKVYLKILCSRYAKTEKILRIKKGIYVSREYITKLEMTNTISSYTEFLSNILYQPSYISLEYALYEHNILTEIPVHFTAISKKKTCSFTNRFGSFIYHTIKDPLFMGFFVEEKNGFLIKKATKAKALFDYLYLRKNIIVNKESFDELRLNVINLNTNDTKEFNRYVDIEGSKKMKEISRHLLSAIKK